MLCSVLVTLKPVLIYLLTCLVVDYKDIDLLMLDFVHLLS